MSYIITGIVCACAGFMIAALLGGGSYNKGYNDALEGMKVPVYQEYDEQDEITD